MTASTIAIVLPCLMTGMLIGWACAYFQDRLLIRAQAAKLELAIKDARTDALTGLWNRKAFDEFIEIQTAISRRYGVPLSLVLFDVDQFKQINDSRGHAAGDEALRQLSRVLLSCIRESDFAARFGGDEFAVVLPQTDSYGAIVVVERVRQRLQTAAFPLHGPHMPLQISAGSATLLADEQSNGLLVRADQALYRSKSAGRNRVHVHNGDNIIDVTSTRPPRSTPLSAPLKIAPPPTEESPEG